MTYMKRSNHIINSTTSSNQILDSFLETNPLQFFGFQGPTRCHCRSSWNNGLSWHIVPKLSISQLKLRTFLGNKMTVDPLRCAARAQLCPTLEAENFSFQPENFSFQRDAVNLSHFQPLLSAKPLEAPGKFEDGRRIIPLFCLQVFSMEIVPKSEELSVRFWYKCANTGYRTHWLKVKKTKSSIICNTRCLNEQPEST